MDLRRFALWTGLAAALLSGCSSRNEGGMGSSKSYLMGMPAPAGLLTYTVLHTTWSESVDTAEGKKYPQRRFLVLDLTVTNTGPEEAGIPLLTLVDASGKEYPEEQKLGGMDGWLGLLRMAGPARTEQGKIVFDAPMTSFKLRVSGGGDPEAEEAAYVEIPLRIEPQAVQGAEQIPGTKQ